jgi:hypothetical protein
MITQLAGPLGGAVFAEKSTQVVGIVIDKRTPPVG